MPRRLLQLMAGVPRWGWLILVICSVTFTLSSLRYIRPSQEPSPRLRVDPALQQHLQLTQSLPAPLRTAVQDLRLIAAVELTFLTERGRYASPEQLKEAGYLDPNWPRAAAFGYQISCQFDLDRPWYTCFALPPKQGELYLRTDPTQVIRANRLGKPSPADPPLEEFYK